MCLLGDAAMDSTDDLCCPDAEKLRRFVLALLSGDEADTLERHLLRCPACCRAAGTVSTDDPLRAALHQATALPADDDERSAVAELMERLRPLGGSVRSVAVGTAVGGDTTAPAAREVRAALAPPGEPDELGRFGPYGILRVLGSGGMGVVLEARDPRSRRTLALKMILAAPSAGVDRLARFHSEPETVARLRHPHIVQVHEVGEYAGRPYFTMEYVGGGSLAARLAIAPLAPRAAAELLHSLAGAVQFAHGQGVVHRDLKPANVLLAKDGAAKITDFGLAKNVAGSVDATAGATQSGAILGTPGYMAPEQAVGGADVGAAADVYALGAILYECLTSRPPFKAATVLQTLEQVRTADPVAPGRIQPGVPRDLQTICLKCLEKEPARRYASAKDLADDLGRFLRGEPVRARPASAGERLKKWVRRKPALAALLAVSGLSLAALVAGGLVYNARLRAAVEKAEANEAEMRRQYRQAHDTLDRMLGRLGDQRLAEAPRLKELQRSLLEDALAFYQDVLQQADSPDPAVRRDTAVACRRAADIQQALGQFGPAAENYRRAIELVEALPAEERDTPECQILLAGCHQNWGTALGGLGRHEEAERHNQAALDILERLGGARPDDPGVQEELARAEHNRGALFHKTKPAEAETHYARAVAIRTTLIRDHPEEEGYQAALAEDYQDLGLLYRTAGREAEASTTYAKAEDLLRPLVDRHPAEGKYSLSLVALYVNWSYVLAGAGRSPEALDRLDRAVRLAEAALRKEPQDTTARQRALAAHGARAEIREFVGRFADSVKDWDRVIELGDGPARRSWRGTRARVLVRAGDHARAAAEAGELAALPETTGDGLYFLARIYAQAIGSARNDTRLPSAERERLADRYAAQAVSLLHKLQGQGYFKDAGHAKALRTEEDLQPLRGRVDFRKLFP
jgi:tetratricopeptide (TPR) repeat protein